MGLKQSNTWVAIALLLVTLVGCSRSNVSAHKGSTKPELQPDVVAAVSKGYVVTLKALLDTGLVDVNAVDKSGDTLLSNAENLEMLEFLLAAGADPNVGKPVLINAAQGGSSEAIAALIKHGAKINCSDAQGVTPLLAAVGSPVKTEVVRLLLDSGADANAKIKDDGYTALMITCRNYSGEVGVQIVRSLLEHGANVNATNSAGETVLSVCRQQYRREPMCEILMSAGAH
jgi:ankyrin repeat protein